MSGRVRRQRRTILPGITALALLGAGLVSAQAAQLTTPPAASAAVLPYQDPSQPVATRVSDLLARMSLDEKLGQMTQAERAALSSQQDIATYRLGSLLSGGGSAPATNSASGWADMYDSFQRTALSTPLAIPMIYGIDAVHGHNNVRGATLFPHNIGLGATRNPALVQQIARATAEEVSGTGIDWDFSPCLCVARDDRWGRTYESFGETPELVSSMATAVTGLQGSALNGPASVLATAKHYVGDGGTTGGDDQGNTQISEAELRAIHLPPFKEAIARGVGSIMVSFSSFNGQKLHGNDYLVNTVLKGELGFSGIVVSDWAAIDQLDGNTGGNGQIGFTGAEITTSINAGLDMIMVPNDYKPFLTLFKAEVNAGRIPMSRIDDANRRILTKKFELGLFENPLTDRTYTSTVGSSAHRALARQAVRESQVLLKNSGGALPIPNSSRIFVAGKNADDLGNQSGGWSISWQGSSGNITTGTTILQGIRNAAGSTSSSVTYSKDGSGISNSFTRAIAVVGEKPYAEGQGDRPNGLSLDSEDLNTLARLKASGVPTVVVLVSGRPMDIASQLSGWDALLASWLPGTEGDGVADVLFGSYNPTGKLPSTWMQSVSQQPINTGDGKTPLFAYGYGLSYGTVPPTTVPPTTTAPPTTVPVTTTTTVPPTTTAPVTTTTAPPTTVPPTTTAPTTTVPVTTTSQGTANSCSAVLKVDSSWSGGFQGTVTVTAGSRPITAWTTAFTLPSGVSLTQVWNGTLTSSGSTATVKPVSWNSALGSGATASYGFIGSGPAPTSAPVVTCTAT